MTLTSSPRSRPEAPTLPHISYCLANASGEPLRERDADRVYYAASTMKLAVLIAAMKLVESGELKLDSQLSAMRNFIGTDGQEFTLMGDHLDDEFPQPGATITVAETLTAMISRSSNEATNMMMDFTGLVPLQGVLKACRLGKTRIERLIGDPAAVEHGLTNVTSAADLVRLIRSAVTGSFKEPGICISPELVQFMTSCLERHPIDPIVSSLPAGVRCGSKSGSIDGVRHDVAFIGDPESPDVLYFAVCTEGIAQPAADVLIAALTDALVVPLLERRLQEPLGA